MKIEESLTAFIKREKLPDSYLHLAQSWFLPLLNRVANKVQLHHGGANAPFLLGINGAQGSGKSTLSSLLVCLCKDVYDLNAVCMSLDDFYLTKDERLALSKEVHPLLQTRGVPGTHDIGLLQQTLKNLKANQACKIPVFAKDIDDRAPKDNWQSVHESPDLIILEGWCVGIPGQTEKELVTAVNSLEHNHDEDGVWRHYANQKLCDEYQNVFSQFDYLIMLKAPSFHQIFAWRCEQEHKMQAKNIAAGLPAGGMSDNQIDAFIQHYQRITEHGLTHLPALCDEVFELNQQRSILRCHIR